MTLVEVAVAVTVVGLLCALLSTVVVHLLQAESLTRNHPSQIHTLGQLADRFRTDVHGAAKLSALDEPNPSVWRIESSDGPTIEYAIGPQQILRSTLVEAEVQSRQAYRLPEQVLAEIQLLQLQNRPLARIHLRSANEARPLLEVVAWIGRDRRFSSDTAP
jgi:hypothetical protein